MLDGMLGGMQGAVEDETCWIDELAAAVADPETKVPDKFII